ncbi:MAG: hypothetical protein GDYSWBUE_001225, partial [Candidatus Fervidibacterota bacterium]
MNDANGSSANAFTPKILSQTLPLIYGESSAEANSMSIRANNGQGLIVRYFA